MGAVGADARVEALPGGVPAVRQAGAEAGIDTGGVFRQRRALGHGVEVGEDRDALIEGIGRDVRRPTDAPELEREQGAEGASRGDHEFIRLRKRQASPEAPAPQTVDDVTYLRCSGFSG